ncbi:hypothetical protein [Ochrobactrum sp. S1502_03]|uniref:hypothetical protein n=1 Tax=Ochrobactrum sp. S1502_03 TaxID=3108451 RepID=UPI0037C73F92
MAINKHSAADTQIDLLNEIRTEGVRAAYAASLAVCNDPKAPAPARATAAATIFRVAGYFERKDREETLEPHEMTQAQLSDAIKRLEQQLTVGKVIDIFS